MKVKIVRFTKVAMTLVAAFLVASIAMATITPVDADPTTTANTITLQGFPTQYRVYSRGDFSATVTADDPTAVYTLPWFHYMNNNGTTVVSNSGGLIVNRGSSNSVWISSSVTWEATRTYDTTAILKTQYTNAILDSDSDQYISGTTFEVYPAP